jgi:chorismate synthase
MAGNTFGQLFRLTTFGESHGTAMGGIIDGCPAGLDISIEAIQNEIDLRKPGSGVASSPRKEDDKVELLSGVFEGKSTGTPIAFIIRNQDHHPDDYDHLRNVFRPGHADYAMFKKFGIRDHRGGGRLSGRETVSRVVGGAVARILLEKHGLRITAFTSGIGEISLPIPEKVPDRKEVYKSEVRCPVPATSQKMIDYLRSIKEEKETTGGVVTCIAQNMPVGLGDPVFDKLEADLAKAMMSIGASRAFELGLGIQSATMKGSEFNDPYILHEGAIVTSSNNAGGINGGISNGNDVIFRVAFRPVSSIDQTQETIDIEGNTAYLEVKGRHDVCMVPRVVPVVEAMTALVLADHYLRQNAIQ